MSGKRNVFEIGDTIKPKSTYVYSHRHSEHKLNCFICDIRVGVVKSYYCIKSSDNRFFLGSIYTDDHVLMFIKNSTVLLLEKGIYF